VRGFGKDSSATSPTRSCPSLAKAAPTGAMPSSPCWGRSSAACWARWCTACAGRC